MGYRRTGSMEDLMQNANRALIYNTIKRNPGSSFTDLRSLLGIKNGTLSHHLVKLEREGVVISKKMGIFRRFYPSGGRVPKDLEEQIMDVVIVRPGISQSRVARELDITRQVANYHIRSLKKRGHLIVRKAGRSSEIFAR
ncbi:MAG: winged helix-turn-helix transcriptional regulator [Candidatus Thermoplasmatota archaeon]|nr:winged helix-turn-helix transcriptional regulator [Candidatus Thermoplasmatota archaeon]